METSANEVWVTCNECNEKPSFSGITLFLSHKRQHHDYTCEECDLKFVAEWEFKKHRSRCHPNNSNPETVYYLKTWQRPYLTRDSILLEKMAVSDLETEADLARDMLSSENEAEEEALKGSLSSREEKYVKEAKNYQPKIMIEEKESFIEKLEVYMETQRKQPVPKEIKAKILAEKEEETYDKMCKEFNTETETLEPKESSAGTEKKPEEPVPEENEAKIIAKKEAESTDNMCIKANIDTEATKRIGIPRKKEDEEAFWTCEYCDYSAGTTQNLCGHIRKKHPNGEGRTGK